jgi:hypothetical protein
MLWRPCRGCPRQPASHGWRAFGGFDRFTVGGIAGTNSTLKDAIMETPILGNKAQFPTDKIIFSHLGKSKALWLGFFQFIADAYPNFTQEWRYYRDGKSWLMKVQYKKKTVFWLSILKGAFRTTFYIHEKARKLVEASTISEELKDQYRTAKSFGKLRAMTVVYKNKKDIEFAKELIGIKMSIK